MDISVESGWFDGCAVALVSVCGGVLHAQGGDELLYAVSFLVVGERTVVGGRLIQCIGRSMFRTRDLLLLQFTRGKSSLCPNGVDTTFQ